MVTCNVPTRFNIAVMLFMASFFLYVLRVNLSIIMLGMVEPIASNSSTISSDYGTRFKWNSHEQSLLLASYFWSYSITTPFGGILSEWFGGRLVIGLATLISSILTGLIPIVLAIYPSYVSLIVIRVLIGAAGGVVLPGVQNLISKWAPPNERGKFVSTLLGSPSGTVVTWMVAGFLMEAFGWAITYYIQSIFSIGIAILWFIIVHETPSQHPRITREERDLIEGALGENIPKSKKSIPPYWSMAKSLPFWALVVLQFGNLWGAFFLVTGGPKFISEVLGFNIASTGVLASLPQLARVGCGFIFGAIGDYFRRHELLSVTATRKLFCVFSQIIPGLLIISLIFCGDLSPYVSVALITISSGINGAIVVTSLQNPQDLAPNYAGTVFALMNCIGTTSGFISPMVVGYFTREKSTLDEWSIVLIIGGSIYILSAVLFILFGSGKVQKWNEKDRLLNNEEHKSEELEHKK